MALHKIRLHHTDGSRSVFFENKDGTWDYCTMTKERDDIPMWYNSLSAEFMIATVCAASDLGTAVSIEKGGDT